MNLIGELRKEKEFRQQCCRNSTKVGERKKRNFGNAVTEIPLPKCHCRNREKKENLFWVIVAMALPKIGKKIEWNYGNVIAENERKKNVVAEI